MPSGVCPQTYLAGPDSGSGGGGSSSAALDTSGNIVMSVSTVDRCDINASTTIHVTNTTDLCTFSR